MLAIGLDYGSTNSLVISFQPQMTGTVTRTHLKSEVRLYDEYIRSPKRLLHNIDKASEEEIKKIQACIHCCVRNMLESHISTEQNHDGAHLAITVPNAFKDKECVVLKKAVLEDACDIFGVSKASHKHVETSIIPEPVAAALFFAYAMNYIKALQREQYVVVSDVGGGTTDLAIVKVLSANRCMEFKVVHTEHMFTLGGNDIDNAIADYFLEKQPELRSISREILVRACCELKVNFSLYGDRDYSEVDILDDDRRIVEIDGEEVVLCMSKDELRTLLSKSDGFLTKYRILAEKLRNKLETELRSGSNDVYLLPVGGTSRLALVRETLKDVFKQYEDNVVELNTEKAQLGASYDSVARGAAIYAAYHAGLIEQDIIIRNRTMHRISLCYGDNRLHECVMQCSSDGVYECRCRCEATHLNNKEGWFRIGTIRLYQGGAADHINEDCEALEEKVVDEKLYLNNRRLEDIGILVKLEIVGGRLRSIEIRAEGCNKDGSDFVTKLEYEI